MNLATRVLGLLAPIGVALGAGACGSSDAQGSSSGAENNYGEVNPIPSCEAFFDGGEDALPSGACAAIDVTTVSGQDVTSCNAYVETVCGHVLYSCSCNGQWSCFEEPSTASCDGDGGHE